MLQQRMQVLKKELIDFATLVEGMIEKSTNGFLYGEKKSLHEVIETNESKANHWEIVIDELCTSLIAQYEPRAKDLRTILMILKMNNDIERMGDHAVNIAQSALFLMQRNSLPHPKTIEKMASISIKMLKDSIESFVHENVSLAQEVCERDNMVDELQIELLKQFINDMTENPSYIEESLHLVRIIGKLERIADLSTNICEDVMFMVEGKIIKHHHN